MGLRAASSGWELQDEVGPGAAGSGCGEVDPELASHRAESWYQPYRIYETRVVLGLILRSWRPS